MIYIKSIDSVRAIAVIIVIINHWFNETHKLNIIISLFNGVDIFFVLSGFLITSILLNAKNSSGEKKNVTLKNFFVRRVLRIFPIYYLTLFILFLLGNHTETSIRSQFIYYITYTSNFYFDKHGWDGMLSHLWSLSVEEQFYLFWPFLILFIPQKRLLLTILLFILIGVFSQYITGNRSLLTFTCFDALGLGALLAWMNIYKPFLLNKFYSILSKVAAFSLMILIIRLISFQHNLGIDNYIFQRTSTAICTTWLLAFILLNKYNNFKITSFILNNNFLIFLGKISYGLYLYHLPLFKFSYQLCNNLNASFPSYFLEYNFYLIRLEAFFLLVLFSWLSYQFIEKPFLSLKSRFEYQKENFKPEKQSSVLILESNKGKA